MNGYRAFLEPQSQNGSCFYEERVTSIPGFRLALLTESTIPDAELEVDDISPVHFVGSLRATETGVTKDGISPQDTQQQRSIAYIIR